MWDEQPSYEPDPDADYRADMWQLELERQEQEKRDRLFDRCGLTEAEWRRRVGPRDAGSGQSPAAPSPSASVSPQEKAA